MALLTVQPLALLSVADTYAACSASDTFAAQQGQKFLLRYVNGGTATTGAIYVRNQNLVAPSDTVPGIPTGGATPFDALVIASTFPASTTRICKFLVDNYLSGGLVTLLHAGTLTTLTVGVFGPL